MDDQQVKIIHNGEGLSGSSSKWSAHNGRGSHSGQSKHNSDLSGIHDVHGGFFDNLDSPTGKHLRRTLFAWAPCKCQAKEIEPSANFKQRRAQDVLWAVPRAAADALFSTTQEYLDRGCATAPWKGSPPPHWLKKCPMYVDGRDNYECIFILRLARFNIGYEVGTCGRSCFD